MYKKSVRLLNNLLKKQLVNITFAQGYYVNIHYY